MQDREMCFIPLLHGRAEKTKRIVGSCGLSWQLKEALLAEVPREDKEAADKSQEGALQIKKQRNYK